MKVSYRTIEALYELSKISATVLIRSSGEASAHDAQIGLRATAQLPDAFPRDIAFGEVDAFLAALVRLGPHEADVRFRANGCTVTANGVEAFVRTANVAKLAAELPRRGDHSAAAVGDFAIDSAALAIWQQVLRRTSGRDSFEAFLSSDGSTVALTLHRRIPPDRRGGLASFRQPIGASAEKFAYGLAAASLAALPSDRYSAAILTNDPPELVLTAATRSLRYAVRLQVSTVETSRTNTQ